jgi:hypothetical protein
MKTPSPNGAKLLSIISKMKNPTLTYGHGGTWLYDSQDSTAQMRNMAQSKATLKSLERNKLISIMPLGKNKTGKDKITILGNKNEIESTTEERPD